MKSNNYEDYNVVSETGDSIFAIIDKELEMNYGDGNGQIYVSKDKIVEIVQKEWNKRLGGLSYNNGNDN